MTVVDFISNINLECEFGAAKTIEQKILDENSIYLKIRFIDSIKNTFESLVLSFPFEDEEFLSFDEDKKNSYLNSFLKELYSLVYTATIGKEKIVGFIKRGCIIIKDINSSDLENKILSFNLNFKNDAKVMLQLH